MKTMFKTKKTQAAQVYFPMEEYIEIKFLALKKGKTIAEWIREASREKKEKEIKKKKHTLYDLAGIIKTTPNEDCSDISEIDRIVYLENNGLS